MLPESLQGFSLPPLTWHRSIQAWYRTMRETMPVCYDPEQEYWLIFRYHDVERVLHDHETFSSEKRSESNSAPALPIILSMDPPRHRLMRSLLSQAFSPRAIAQKAPRIAAIVEELLAPVLLRGEMDLIEDFAAPLPTWVVAEMLGVSSKDVYLFNQWTEAIITAPPDEADSPSTQEQMLTPPLAMEAMYAYFAPIIQDRRQRPRPDLISQLVASEINGQPLSEIEVFGFCFTLLQAGHIMVTNLLGNAFLCFFEYPEVLQQLRQEPSLLPTAIEEVMRYLPPMRGIGAGKKNMLNRRIALTDTVIGGKLIRKNEAVNVSIASANFDERAFDNPEQFDIQRNPNRHLSFGYGIHFCLGAQLARLELQIALEQFLKRFPQMRLKPGAPLEQVRSHVLLGVKKLPLLFETEPPRKGRIVGGVELHHSMAAIEPQ